MIGKTNLEIQSCQDMPRIWRKRNGRKDGYMDE